MTGDPNARETATTWALCALTTPGSHTIGPPLKFGPTTGRLSRVETMKIRNSLKSLKGRDKDCRVIRRKGRVYVINKKNPRFKARQG